MLNIKGTVISKKIVTRPVRAEVLFLDSDGDNWSLQLRPKNFTLLAKIDVGASVLFTVRNEISASEKSIINNLIVINATIL